MRVIRERPVQSIKDLERGDIIRHKGTGKSYVVTANYGTTVIAVDTYQVSNPDEWLLVEVSKG